MPPERPILSAETLVRLGPAIVLSGAFLTGALWINTTLGGVDRRVEQLTHRVELIESNWNTRLDSIATRTDQSVSLYKLQAWSLQLKISNPDLNVPSVE
jgi:hypothetical protein